MDILQKIKHYAEHEPDRIAVCSETESITYKELDEFSDILAAYLNERCGNYQGPIGVYGHKSPYMLVSFLACVKSKRAYCPIDVSVPDSRAQAILDTIDAPVTLAVEELSCTCREKISLEDIKSVVKQKKEKVNPENFIRPEDVFYIIFTSGSTGTPKGVQITSACLNHYLDWSVSLGNSMQEKEGKVFLNQAPFSFDLSVMDVYTCLACGGTLWTLDKETQKDYTKLMKSLHDSKASIWVSTPSFADVCLIEKGFLAELMPELKVFLFCGETLTNATVRKLHERFPDACVMNTYGPTESTVAVTEVEVTKELNETVSPLPVGKAKPGTCIEIWREDGSEAPDGEKGEIIILGDTVSTGYFKQPDITGKSFFTCERKGRTVRGYRTGDEGCLKDGMLYYSGRIDLQIKLHGYRIEIEDIENNILKLPEISKVVVLPKLKDGKVKSLVAAVVQNRSVQDSFAASVELKKRLKEFLPDYMIPKKFIFMDKLPMTNNGKIDRKLLGGQI